MKINQGKKKTALKAVIYGPEGIGKSTLASQFPDPLFLDLENGTNQLDVKRAQTENKTSKGHIETYSDIGEILKAFEQDPSVCQTLVFDTADMVERIIKNYICAKEGVKAIDKIGYHKGYYFLADEIQKLLNLLSRLVRDYNVNVVFLAHSKTKKWELPDETGSYDRYELNLEKEVAPLFKQWADLLLFINYQINVVKTGDGFSEKYKATGGKRVIYTTHSPTWDAKNRFGLPEEMPLGYENLKPLFDSKVEKPAKKEEPEEKTYDTLMMNEEDIDKYPYTEIVGDPIVAKIVNRLNREGLSEKEATDMLKSRNIDHKNEGDWLSDYDSDFLQRNVLDKWDGFKNKLKGDK